MRSSSGPSCFFFFNKKKETFVSVWQNVRLPLSQFCEGGGDVVGVVTPLVGGVAQAFHDDRVVELTVQLGVQEVEGKDREEQVEVERERRVKEVRPWMTMDMFMTRLRS